MTYSREHHQLTIRKRNNAIPFLLCFFCFSYLPNWAQTSTTLEQADKLYRQQAYSAAAKLYEGSESDLNTLERLANSYRLNHDTENAERYYAQLVKQTVNPINYLHYAQTLQCNGKLDLAKEFYLKYDRAMSGEFDNRGSQMAAAIDRLTKHGSEEVVLENVTTINSKQSDFGPVFHQNGIVFASTRSVNKPSNNRLQNIDKWTGDNFAALYLSDIQEDGTLSLPQVFSTGLNTKFHEGPLAFSKKGDRLFYTRNISPKKNNTGKEHFLKIGIAIKEGRRWLKDGLADLGNENCNDVHPALSADSQQLIFASDRLGGYGGMDLYISRFSNNQWGLPINLGPTINTAGNEVSPFLYDDGTLYFASDGWGGFGGLDIFHCQTDEYGDWEQATNLGQPFNSNKDDFGYVLSLTGTEGYLASAREGGLGKDDIYHFTLPMPQSNKLNYLPNTTICVVDEMNGQQIKGASLTVYTKSESGEYVGFENGTFVKLIEIGGSRGFKKQVVQADPFVPSEPINSHLLSGEKGLFDLYLIESNDYLFNVKIAGYEEVFYFYNKNKTDKCIPLKPSNCTYLRGRVTEKQSGKFLPNATITLNNLRTNEIKTGITDTSGHYQFCIENGCDFIINASKESYSEDYALVSTFQLNGKSGLTNQDLQLLATADLPSSFNSFNNDLEKGFLIELEHLYYDYGQSDLRTDATKELDQIAIFLKRNPNLSIELRSHTDSRGEAVFNKELSQRRAQKAADYLIAKGIPEKRVTANGMGEDQLLNDCMDGKKCTEEEHQMNRRTEVRFFE